MSWQNFKPGVPLCRDLRNEVIELAAKFPVREVGRRLHIQPLTVSRYVKLYWDKGNTDPAPRMHMQTVSELSLADTILLETLVESKGSTSLNKINSQLSNFGGCEEVSISTTLRHVCNKLPSARKYSSKQLGKFAYLWSAKLQMFDNNNNNIYLNMIRLQLS